MVTMLVVALTGGIASGKSVVADVLESLGCYVHSSDLVAHKLMNPEKPAWKKIVVHFGEKILNADKTINRERLGAIVFSNEKERRFLNQLIHPLVFEKKKEIINKLRTDGHYKIFISEAALTIEAGYADFFDKIVTVYCQEKIQIQRLMERDQITQRKAFNKIRSQMQTEVKLKYADYIIDTSCSIQDTVEQTERVYRNLMMDYELKSSTI